MAPMSEEPKEPAPPADDSSIAENEDDKRADAAAVNRKRALEQWERNKKRWRAMGVPDASPAAGSTKK
jgi:hypothetical protein